MNKNKKQLESIIRDISQNYSISHTPHCRRRMSERSVWMDDFLHVINWGKIAQHNWSEKHDCYECTIVGKDIEGDALTLVIAVDEKNFRIRCITVE